MLSTQITHANDNASCGWRRLGAPAALLGRPAPGPATEIARTRWPAKESKKNIHARDGNHEPESMIPLFLVMDIRISSFGGMAWSSGLVFDTIVVNQVISMS
jgi:hypothetical protein